MAGGWSRAHGTGDQVAADTLRSIGHDSCALDENLRATRPVSRSLICWSNRCDGRATMPDPDWIEEIKRSIERSIADLDRYRLKAEVSGYYDMANRLKDQIRELDRRVKELQRTYP
jgi:hypothetical protein